MQYRSISERLPLIRQLQHCYHFCLLLLLSAPVFAQPAYPAESSEDATPYQLLVLVHGYLGSSKTWYENGVVPELEQAGWVDGRQIVAGGRSRIFYAVDLPSEAPIPVQARFLLRYLAEFLRRHSPARLVLVGHSAGGLVSRATVVQRPDLPVTTLITIATPHLGTDRAELGALIGQTPLSWMAPMMGAGTLNRSHYLYRDMAREGSGNLLFTLNRMPHPALRYISILRSDGSLSGDLLVPRYSQDMNNVAALRGRAEVVPTRGDHNLKAADGWLIVQLLRRPE